MPYEKINNADVFYEAIGKGNPLYILAGCPCSPSYFMPYISQLKETSSLFFLDIRGTGKSSKINTAEFTLENITKDIEEFRKKKNHDSINLLGHSFGGNIVQQYAINYSGNAGKIILVSTQHGAPKISLSFNLKISLLMLQSYFSLPILLKKRRIEDVLKDKFFNSMMDFYFLNKKQEYCDKYRESFTPYLDMIKQSSITLKQDSNKDLSKIRCETLIIAGKYDKMLPLSKSQELNKLIKNSELKILDSGHFPFMEKTEEFNKIVAEFLK